MTMFIIMGITMFHEAPYASQIEYKTSRHFIHSKIRKEIVIVTPCLQQCNARARTCTSHMSAMESGSITPSARKNDF